MFLYLIGCSRLAGCQGLVMAKEQAMLREAVRRFKEKEEKRKKTKKIKVNIVLKNWYIEPVQVWR